MTIRLPTLATEICYKLEKISGFSIGKPYRNEPPFPRIPSLASLVSDQLEEVSGFSKKEKSHGDIKSIKTRLGLICLGSLATLVCGIEGIVLSIFTLFSILFLVGAAYIIETIQKEAGISESLRKGAWVVFEQLWGTSVTATINMAIGTWENIKIII